MESAWGASLEVAPVEPSRLPSSRSRHPLQDGCDSLATGGAQRDQGGLFVAALELLEGGAEEQGTGGAGRVAERDPPAIHVDALGIEIELAHRLQHHRGERFVDLPEVDVARAHSGETQCLLAHRRRSREHDDGIAAQRGHGADARPGKRAGLADIPLRRDEQRAGAVRDPARVAGGVDVTDLPCLGVGGDGDLIERLAVRSGRRPTESDECGREPGESFARRVRAEELVALQDELAGDGIGNGYERPGKASLLHRAGGAPLRAERDLVYFLAGKVLQRGDEVGADPLRDLEEALAKASVAAVFTGAVRTHGDARHALHAARDHQIEGAGSSAHRREIDRLQARAAEPVERGRAHLDRPARAEHRVAGQVRALLVHLRDAPRDHVVDARRVEAVAAGERHQQLREQLLWMDPGERALPRLSASARSAHRIDDVARGHDRSPFPPRAAAAPSARQARSTSSDSSVPFTARARLSPPYINATSPIASIRRGTIAVAGRRCARPSTRAVTWCPMTARCCGAVVPTSPITAGKGQSGAPPSRWSAERYRLRIASARSASGFPSRRSKRRW